jgi:hypothetical protein
MKEMRARHQFDPDAIDRITVRVSYLDTVSPAPASSRRVAPPPGPTTLHYFAAHVALYGGFAQVGEAPYGHEGSDHSQSDAAPDERVLAFARERVSVIGEYGRAGFSPAIEVRLKDGTTYLDDFAYERMMWDFDALVARLEASTARYPLGRPAFDALVEAVRHAEHLESVAPLFALVAHGTPAGHA